MRVVVGRVKTTGDAYRRVVVVELEEGEKFIN